MGAIAELEATLAGVPSAVVAFSGGVDSSVVAAAAARVLGDRAVAVTAVSPALASGELDGARAVAQAIGIEHQAVATHELSSEGYRRNGRDRCYHCKVELYEVLDAVARRRGLAAVLSGANADDLGDWRPGLRAAAERGVRHPLVEAGLGKVEVRAIARDLGLPNAAKPASPCLSSRLPYGTPVEVPTLRQVDRAESALKRLGFRDLRVRHFGPLARVELGPEDLPRATTVEGRRALEDAVRAAGYAEVRVEPFVSGSLNRIGRPLPIVGT
ncbi:MAG TPA: ATP-dependent sacrificial sulfur transferase LarE [Actinomycetota bacterium]|nr:ATP-dependent sacrificial sulfur transferase LarE [Actinomycetota bacterium]